jgi:hypothetical protein
MEPIICRLCSKPILDGQMYHTLFKEHTDCIKEQERRWAEAKARGAAAIKKVEDLLRKKK